MGGASASGGNDHARSGMLQLMTVMDFTSSNTGVGFRIEAQVHYPQTPSSPLFPFQGSDFLRTTRLIKSSESPTTSNRDLGMATAWNIADALSSQFSARCLHYHYCFTNILRSSSSCMPILLSPYRWVGCTFASVFPGTLSLI